MPKFFGLGAVGRVVRRGWIRPRDPAPSAGGVTRRQIFGLAAGGAAVVALRLPSAPDPLKIPTAREIADAVWNTPIPPPPPAHLNATHVGPDTVALTWSPEEHGWVDHYTIHRS